MSNSIETKNINNVNTAPAPEMTGLIPQTSTTDLSVVNNPTVMSASGVTADPSTTTFVDDGVVVTNDTSHDVTIDDTIVKLNDTQSVEQGIKDFLAKPIVAFSGTFATTDTFSFLTTEIQPSAGFATANAVLWREKLKGFLGIKMDMVFRIVVNANKFQAGRYCMSWVPLCGADSSTSQLKEVNFITNIHMATIVQRTTLKRVEFDLNTTTSAELRIPWTSVRAYYPLTNIDTSVRIGELGGLCLWPYSPLVSPAGSTTASYTVYMHLENVSLFGVCSPQSGLTSRKRHGRRDNAQEELGNKLNGPISGTAQIIGSIARATSRLPIPGLSEFATTLGWVSDRVAGAANVLGFSKPSQGDSQVKMQVNVAPNHVTIDGDSDAKSLSFLSKPGVIPVHGIGSTSLDEMDFSFITRIYANKSIASWSTADAVSTELHGLTLQLSTMSQSIGSATNYLPVGFVASFFQMWRGSLKVKYKLVKTDFHSGRIMICHYPRDVSGATTERPAYVNRVIWDVRENNEMEIIVPYISQTAWSRYGDIVGTLKMTVLDTLVAPASVSSSVAILIEVCGGDDIQFAVPQNGIPLVPTVISPQSGLSKGNEDNIFSSTVGTSVVKMDNLMASAIATGDRVSNFRALLKRNFKLAPSSLALISTRRFNTGSISCVPDVLHMSGTTADSYPIVSDMYAIIGLCYGMSRGGVIFRDVIDAGLFTASTNTNGPAMVTANIGRPNTGLESEPFYGNTSFIQSPYLPSVFQNVSQNPVITVEMPQYTSTYARANCDIMHQYGSTTTYHYNNKSTSSGTIYPIVFSVPANSITAGTAQAVAGYSVHNLSRIMADDASFHCFISIPPMVSGPANSYTNVALY